MELVNVVASGTVERELKLRALREDLDAKIATEYNERMNSLILRFESPSATIILYTSGNFVITGCGSPSELKRVQTRLQNALSSLGIISNQFELKIEINNMVYTADLGKSVNLNLLVLEIGHEHAEYEPEQNPFVIYRPSGHSCSVTVSSSGKSVISGAKSESEAMEVFEHLRSIVEREKI
jgi:transcription initiation factor TFIID TATA-box-binding protein